MAQCFTAQQVCNQILVSLGGSDEVAVSKQNTDFEDEHIKWFRSQI